jgi:hypothetical protein
MGEWKYSFTFSSPRHLLEVSGQLHVLATLLRGKEHPVPILIRGCVSPRAGLVDVEKRRYLTLLGLELGPLCRPAHS